MYPVRRHLSSLSGPQRDALGAALGLTSGKAPRGFPVAAGVVELLVTLAEEQAVLCLVRRCAMDRPAVSRGAHLRAATAARCYSMRRMRGGGGGQVGRANNLLKEARQSACSESEPGRVDHYMEGSKPGQGRRFSMDAARSGARSRIRPAPLRRISYPSEGVPGSHANGRSSTGRRQVQPVFQLSRAPRGLVADPHVLTWAPARR